MNTTQQQLWQAIGTWERCVDKTRSLKDTVIRAWAFRKRRKRLMRLKKIGLIDAVPNEWQITQAAYAMFNEFILPSNDEFYAHYDQNMYWFQFLRLLDEPSVFIDPTGLSIPRDVLIRHVLNVVHTSAGYDVQLLETHEGGLEELERQLKLLIAGEHPDQDEIIGLIERKDYPTYLLEALQRYRQNRVKHWAVLTYETPEGCEETFNQGIERFGSLSRLMGYASKLPKTPWQSFGQAVGLASGA
jgi:hypothetical protein